MHDETQPEDPSDTSLWNVAPVALDGDCAIDVTSTILCQPGYGCRGSPHRSGDERAALCPVALPVLVGGKYRLEEPLSRGGMGSLWTARHATLGSPVAVKFMNESLASSPELVSRFEREARIAANLQSPHVVRV